MAPRLGAILKHAGPCDLYVGIESHIQVLTIVHYFLQGRNILTNDICNDSKT